MQKPSKPATYSDLCAVPEHLVAEIIDGELVTSPRPAARHARAASTLGWSLGPNGSGGPGPGGWIILDEPELHLSADVLVPDLAGWRRERMPELPDVAFFTLAPDWVCEVLSPSTARRDRADKLALYRQAGVSHAWLVDPVLQTLEVLATAEGRALSRDWSGRLQLGVYAGDIKVRAEPFAALELDLAPLWAR